MMMRPFPLKIFFVVLLILGLGLGVVIGMSQDTSKPSFISSIVPSPFVFQAPTPVPSASPVPVIPAPTETEWTSPNGKSILKMKETVTSLATEISPENRMYSFYVTTSTDPEEKLVFSKSVNAPTTMLIPFNSWAPDNKHFYVQEVTPSAVKSFVFNASGETFADASPFIDVQTVFEEKITDYTLREVTGWAAPSLLIINSLAAELQDGPSYWLDVNRKSLTRLSTSFQ